jgi:hypothetical protein
MSRATHTVREVLWILEAMARVDGTTIDAIEPVAFPTGPMGQTDLRPARYMDNPERVQEATKVARLVRILQELRLVQVGAE